MNGYFYAQLKYDKIAFIILLLHELRRDLSFNLYTWLESLLLKIRTLDRFHTIVTLCVDALAKCWPSNESNLRLLLTEYSNFQTCWTLFAIILHQLSDLILILSDLFISSVIIVAKHFRQLKNCTQNGINHSRTTRIKSCDRVRTTVYCGRLWPKSCQTHQLRAEKKNTFAGRTGGQRSRARVSVSVCEPCMPRERANNNYTQFIWSFVCFWRHEALLLIVYSFQTAANLLSSNLTPISATAE